jgi:hypothetical protein
MTAAAEIAQKDDLGHVLFLHHVFIVVLSAP